MRSPRDEGVLAGSTRIFAAETLFPVTALLIAAYLSRRLGADGYGLVTLAAVIVSWIEWTIVTVFARTLVKFVREAPDWEAVATTTLRAQLVAGGVAAALLVVTAGPVSALLGEPQLAPHLRIFACDIPVFLLAHGHRSVLAGLGRYRDRAVATAGRWLARLALILGVVELGGDTYAVLLAMIGGSVVELALGRRAVRPPLLRASGFRLATMAGYVVPIGVHAICLRLFDRADLLLLTALGGSARDAGHYGAAQNLSLLAPLVGASVAPVLLSSLTLAWAPGSPRADGDALARRALEAALLIFPLMALVAGAAPGLVTWLFGAAFEPAATPLAWLAVGAAAQTVGGTAANVLVAGGAPRLCVLVGPVMLGVAVCGHVVFIPRGGAPAAAAVTAAAAGVGLVVALALVRWRHGLGPRPSCAWRTALLAAAGYGALVWWAPTGWVAGAAPVAVALALVPAAVALRLVLVADLRAALDSVLPRRRRRPG